jgi:hypothetical protein
MATLETIIEIHLKVYKELLTDYKAQLKGYLKSDISPALIGIQEMLINNTKAKISALEDLIKQNKTNQL